MTIASTNFGFTISFASGFLAEITNVTLPEQVREKIEATHSTSPDNRAEYILRDYVDSGDLQVEINFDPDAEPPIDSAFEPVTMTFPSGTTWGFSGALTNYSGDAPIDDRMTASATLAITGKITITSA